MFECKGVGREAQIQCHKCKSCDCLAFDAVFRGQTNVVVVCGNTLECSVLVKTFMKRVKEANLEVLLVDCWIPRGNVTGHEIAVVVDNALRFDADVTLANNKLGEDYLFYAVSSRYIKRHRLKGLDPRMDMRTVYKEIEKEVNKHIANPNDRVLFTDTDGPNQYVTMMRGSRGSANKLWEQVRAAFEVVCGNAECKDVDCVPHQYITSGPCA